MKLYKIISILLSCAIAVTTLSVVVNAKSEKFEDVPIATENVELAEPEEMASDSFDKVPKLVLRSIDILISIDEAQNRTTFIFGNDSIVTGVKYNGVEKISYTYDLLKRQTKKTVNTTVPFTTSYEYKNIDNYRTSTLIDKISYSDGTALSYTYDANGNILTIKDQSNNILASYTYDNLNQLTGATVGSDVYTYTYDNGGNIVSKTKNGVEVAYTYGNTEWKDLLTAYNGISISYDIIGNPLNWINGETFSWSGGRQLTGITKGDNTISYTYNDNGIRTSKTVNGIRTDYYLNGTAIIMQKTGDNVIWYTYDENGNVAGMSYNGSDYWFYRNAQNDVIGIVDSSGAVVAKYTYDDWGKVLAVTDGQGNDISSNATHIANINPIRYRGYYYDTETGLYYLQSRYYDAEVGRFINADGYISTGQGTVGSNMFAYCGNNPVNRTDNTGRFWIGALILTAVVTVCAITLSGCTPKTSTSSAPPDYIKEQSTKQNCYSYAFRLPHSANPGDYSAKSNSDYMFKTKNKYTPDEITKYIERDMKELNKSVRVVDSPKDKLDDEYIVAMKTSTKVIPSIGVADYHFAVQLSDGTWADKPGQTPSRWNKINGTAVTWDLGNIKDYYNTETVYFAVKR